MKHNQDITETKSITAGEYTQIEAPIYTDDTDATLETNLAGGVVEWHLKGESGVNLVSKSSATGGITVNSPTGYIIVLLDGADTEDLRSGEYYHIAEFTVSGVKRGLFDGVVAIDNRAGGE